MKLTRMLLIKLSNFVSKTTLVILYVFFIVSNINGEESIDIWKNQKNSIKKNNEIQETKESTQINVLEKNNSKQEITIIEEQTNSETIKLLGLHDPGKNDLTLNMWVNTDGELIKNTFNRIVKSELSNFSEELFEEVIFTYSYPPNKNLSQEDFLKLKINWLIKKSKISRCRYFKKL